MVFTSIAMFSQIHKNRFRPGIDLGESSYIWLDDNNQEVECTAIFIPESFWRWAWPRGHTEMNSKTVKDYVMYNRYYLWSDMEFRGIVIKPKKMK